MLVSRFESLNVTHVIVLELVFVLLILRNSLVKTLHKLVRICVRHVNVKIEDLVVIQQLNLGVLSRTCLCALQNRLFKEMLGIRAILS